jgi:hypothetical protein
MLRFILKYVLEYVIEKYFQIVLLMSKMLSSSGYED